MAISKEQHENTVQKLTQYLKLSRDAQDFIRSEHFFLAHSQDIEDFWQSLQLMEMERAQHMIESVIARAALLEHLHHLAVDEQEHQKLLKQQEKEHEQRVKADQELLQLIRSASLRGRIHELHDKLEEVIVNVQQSASDGAKKLIDSRAQMFLEQLQQKLGKDGSMSFLLSKIKESSQKRNPSDFIFYTQAYEKAQGNNLEDHWLLHKIQVARDNGWSHEAKEFEQEYLKSFEQPLERALLTKKTPEPLIQLSPQQQEHAQAASRTLDPELPEPPDLQVIRKKNNVLAELAAITYATNHESELLAEIRAEDKKLLHQQEALSQELKSSSKDPSAAQRDLLEQPSLDAILSRGRSPACAAIAQAAKPNAALALFAKRQKEAQQEAEALAAEEKRAPPRAEPSKQSEKTPIDQEREQEKVSASQGGLNEHANDALLDKHQEAAVHGNKEELTRLSQNLETQKKEGGKLDAHVVAEDINHNVRDRNQGYADPEASASTIGGSAVEHEERNAHVVAPFYQRGEGGNKPATELCADRREDHNRNTAGYGSKPRPQWADKTDS